MLGVKLSCKIISTRNNIAFLLKRSFGELLIDSFRNWNSDISVTTGENQNMVKQTNKKIQERTSED